MFHYFQLPEKIHASRGYVDFLPKIFCLTGPQNTAVVNSLVIDQFRGSKKFVLEGMGEYQDFPSKNFGLTVPNRFRRRESFSFSLVSASEKFYVSEGFVNFLVKFLSHSGDKFRRSTFLCCVSGFQEFSGSEKVFVREGGVVKRFSVEKFFSHSAKKSLSGSY